MNTSAQAAPDSDRTDSTAETGAGNSAKRAPQKPAVRNRLSKDHQDYWASRLRKRKYTAGNEAIEIPEWQVRMFFDRREAWFNLGTTNRAAAAVKARNVWRHVQAHGLDSAIREFKRRSEHDDSPKAIPTLGEYLSAVEGAGELSPRTFLNYRNCLRTVVGEAFGVKPKKGASRFDYRTGGNQEWAKRIDAIRLSRLTGSRIEAWKRTRLKKAGNSPARLSSTKRTINSYLRCCRSLFSRELVSKLKDVSTPAPIPFSDVSLIENPGSMRYVSKINPETLIVAAENELKARDPEAYKVFLLAVAGGMRKGEIDLLEWNMLDFERNLVLLHETEWLHLKTSDSAGEITLDPEVMAELRDVKKGSKSRFVISSEVVRKYGKRVRTTTRRPRADSARPYYRCAPVFDLLNQWLRGKGVTANKPLHELRKELGAQIATQHGIYAASRFLRHSDITTTARHYADQKERISVGFGAFLRRGNQSTENAKAG